MADDSAAFDELARAVRDLSLRVQHLERRLGEISPDEPLQPQPRASSALESRIGSQWLNRIGVVAVLFGVAYLLRYLFLSQWVSAAAWIWLGVSAGIVVIAGSEWFRRHGYRVLSLSLKATGVGVIYLSLWAGMELYRFVSGPETFAALVVLTAIAAALALRESSEVLAALALIGGFLTPLLISIPSDQVPLFSYMAVLNVAAAGLALHRNWWKLLPVAFVGTIPPSVAWYFNHDRRAELAVTVAAATVFFAIFCATAARLRRRAVSGTGSVRTLAAVELADPVLYFAALYILLAKVTHDSIAIPAVALALLYFALARTSERSLRANRFAAVYGGLGIAFIAAALAVLLPTDWLSLGWFLATAAVMTVGFWRDLPWLRWGALLLLCVTVIKAFAFDVWQLGLGYRTLSFIGLGVLLLAISFVYQRYGFSMMTKPGKH